MADFVKTLERVGRTHGVHQVFCSFARFAACAVAAQTREAEYLEEVKRYTRPEMDVFTQAFAELTVQMENAPFEDLLGPAYMDSLGKRGQQHGGEFHTPPAICQLMARLTLAGSPIPESGPITVCEPCVGAGAMILALAESLPRHDIRRLRVTAIDINRTACDMCFVNTTLWGIPCRVHHGDTLRLQFHASWSNIHYIAPWLAAGLIIPKQGEPPTIHEATAITRVINAQQLGFGLEEVTA